MGYLTARGEKPAGFGGPHALHGKKGKGVTERIGAGPDITKVILKGSLKRLSD